MTNNKDIKNRSKPQGQTVHDEIVEKIVKKNKALSHSIWTDEPVLKPKKSVWLDIDEEEEKPQKLEEKPQKREFFQSVEESVQEKTDDVIIPFSMEKNHISGTKKEISMEISADGKVKKLPNKRTLTIQIPDDNAAWDKGPVIAGRRVEIIDKRSPVIEKKAENPNRVEATINIRVPFEETVKPADSKKVKRRKR